MDKAKILLIIVLVLSVASFSNAIDVIYVDVNGPNDPGTGTFDDPFLRIQNAIDAANAGDVVEIRPGIYTGQGNYNLDPNGKSITIRSIDPNIAANTIIDPNGAGRGFYFHRDEDANCIISGLTITNGYTGGKGGGIFCYYSSPTITNCIISGNSAGTHGGGFFCQLSSLAIIRCVISSNSAILDGGGLECWSGNPTIMNCLIINNHALYGNGGGVDCFNAGNPTVTNCTFVKNSSDSGGALYSLGSSVTLKNNILWANDANQGPQVALEPYSGMTSSVSIGYSDVEGVESAVYDPCGGLVWGSGNIDVDPRFAVFDANGAPNLWDFHLQSAYGRWNTGFYNVDFNADKIINLLDFAVFANEWMENGNNLSADLNHNGTVDWVDLRIFTNYFLTTVWLLDDLTSPCVDAGDPNSDWTGEPWPNGKRINMGAYGGTSQASKNGNIADFDINGLVNFVDFADFADKWFVQEPCIQDLTNNGVVDYRDLDVFVANWLWQKE